MKSRRTEALNTGEGRSTSTRRAHPPRRRCTNKMGALTHVRCRAKWKGIELRLCHSTHLWFPQRKEVDVDEVARGTDRIHRLLPPGQRSAFVVDRKPIFDADERA